MSADNMSEWKPDMYFLEFFLKDATREFGDADKKIGIATESGQLEYSIRDYYEQMKQGTPLGKKLYDNWYNDQEVLERYVAYKAYSTVEGRKFLGVNQEYAEKWLKDMGF